MQCPVDGETLVMTERSGVEIDYCPRCRGVWLDRGELDKIIARSAAPDHAPASAAAGGAPSGRAAAPSLAEPRPPAAPRAADPRPPPRADDWPAVDRPRRQDDDDDDDARDPRRRRRKSFLDDLFDF